MKQKKKTVFYQSLGTYLVVNIAFFLMNIISSPENLWFYWLALPWGLAIALQGVRTFSSSEEKEVKSKKSSEDDFDKRKEKFFISLKVYLVVNLFLVALDLLTEPDHLWFYWVTLGWGMGIGIQAVGLFISEKK